MRSGTSCFNGPLFRKNMARFWPIWASYTLIWAFLIPLQFLTLPGHYPDQYDLLREAIRQAEYVVRTLQPGVFLSWGFGVAAAMAVFSYLCFNRSACMMHALPMDRKGLFFTNYLSGLSFLILPNVAIFLTTLAIEAMYGCVRLPLLLTWLWVQSATVLFFYSFAVFCAMFTGNLLALPAFYGILSYLAYIVFGLLTEVLGLFFYGWHGLSTQVEEVVLWLTPVLKLYESCDNYREVLLSDGGYARTLTNEVSDPQAILIFAALGVVLALVALWVYHRRHVESAGDVVAIPIVRPFFRAGVAVCSGLCFGIVTASVLNYEDEGTLGVFMVAWAVIGYFVAEMLLRKSFRVLKAWKGAAVMAIIMGVLFVSVKMDWYGYESNIPTAEEVTQVHVTSLSDGGPYDDGHYGAVAYVTDPKQIQQIIDLHAAAVHEKDRQDQPGDDYFTFAVEYTLADGSTLERRYRSIPVFEGEQEAVDSVTKAAKQLLSNRDFVREIYGMDNHQSDRISEVYLESTWSSEYEDYRGDNVYLNGTGEDLKDLWQAVQQDFEEGTIGVRYLVSDSEERLANTYTANLTFVFVRERASVIAENETVTMATENGKPTSQTESYHTYLSICLTPQAKHTLEWLETNANIQPGDELMTNLQVREIESR